MRFYCTCYLHMVRSRCISQEGQVKLNFGNVPHFFRPKLSFTIRSSLHFKPALKDNWHCFLHRESTTELSWYSFQLLSLFNTKNLRRCIFRAFSGVDFSKFIKAAPTYGYSPMACTIFTNRRTIFDSNSHGASNVELIPSLKKGTGYISNVFLLLRFFLWEDFYF